MNRIIVAFFSIILLLIGCTADKAPAEPTPNPQVEMQSRMDMSKWLLDARYLHFMCSKAAGMIQRAYQNPDNTDANVVVASLIDSYKKPGGLLDSLYKLHSTMRTEETRLEAVAEKDARIFDNLKRSNTMIYRYINLLSTLPESPEVFRNNQQQLEDQLSSIIKIMTIEFPESTDELAARTSEDNIESRALLKAINDIPLVATPEPVVESPEEAEAAPSPTPTTPPIKTWRDADGNIRMGYNPPEGAEIIELQSQLSGSVGISEPTPAEEPQETQEQTRSMIWVDENGVTHMGQHVPEGQQAKPADEIPLMIGK